MRTSGPHTTHFVSKDPQKCGKEERIRVVLTVFGAFIVTLMMIFYALEQKSPWFTFAFGLACFGSATYGWLAGTWPFGVVESIWGVVAFRKWFQLRRASS